MVTTKVRASAAPGSIRRSSKAKRSVAPAKQQDKQAADKVNVSTAADKMKSMSQVASDVPEIRVDRVREIQEQIANGTYHVSAEDIADKLVDHVIQQRMRS